MSEETIVEETVETTDAVTETVVEESPKAPSSFKDMLNEESDNEVAEQEQEVSETEELVEEGERPEWLPEKFKSAEDMAKSYEYLEGKLGSFTGAPEEGYADLSAEDIGAEMEWFTEGDAGLNAFKGLASEMGVSQEGFTKMMEFYAKSEDAREANLHSLRIQSLTDEYGSEEKASKELQTLASRTKGILGEEGAELLINSLDGKPNSSVNILKLVNGILDAKQGKEFKQPTKNITETDTTRTEDKLRSMLSDPRYKKDAGYRKQVDEAYSAYYDKK